jgi:polyhydroxyalkanoate synthesis regulator phasin
MGDVMKELLKSIVYTGVGAAFLTKDKIEELKSELVEKGKMTQEEGKQFVDELIGKSEKAKEQLELWLNKRVEERVKQLNLATIDEVNDLRRQVEELQVALNRQESEND